MIENLAIGIMKTIREIFIILLTASIVAMYLERKRDKKILRFAIRIFVLSLVLTLTTTVIIIIMGGMI